MSECPDHYKIFLKKLNNLRQHKELVDFSESDWMTDRARESAHRAIRRECVRIWGAASYLAEIGEMEEEALDIQELCEQIGDLKL